ncbi:hypothetical protein B9Z19DRAFT_1065385 [Tuber borchii]|uniref:Uncharacterized protein n=1 Tax=Tuber borchii TaxID=42251 RepID=A0A2T6ZR82_TUBBO|nr:hypothetical protein B9Z19DRAFT_1065385 [Tuber borchii]
MGSISQLTPGVQAIIQNGCRRGVLLGSRGSGSGSQQNQSCFSPMTLNNYQPSRWSLSPGSNETSIPAKPPKRPQRSTIQTRVYIEPEADHNVQDYWETVHLSDDSSNAYQNLGDTEETKSDTEPDTETLDIEEGTVSEPRHSSQTAGQLGNSSPMTVRISTTLESQEASLAPRMPLAQ